MPVQNITVGPEDASQRLDSYLARILADVPSRTYVKNLIDGGRVTVNGKKVKAHYKISPGEKIIADLPDTEGGFENIEPEEIPLDVFYEDDCLLVINKPVGMLVHPAPGVQTGTLVNALLFRCQNLSDANESFRPGIVHRLDRETSGLILVAKDNQTHAHLAGQFETHTIRKRYAAVVHGEINYDEGVVDAPVGRHPVHFDKKTVSYEENAREAKTVYRVIRRGAGKTLVALFPESGRTHQLRVHMAHLGHPILGDDKYGKGDHFPRLALHAQGIGLVHPRTERDIEFFSPMPSEFRKVFINL
ncbi:MAG: RluA family pseudouridine synthase [Candidatus Omnitrophota bacterium]|nr:RluA family pseudouridine synthase [Candidatus Omnitrophota bacterium]MDZ4241609.1 RluA family pseudouridine synthase [Candidatus Omnitrophota bacterium]